MGKLALFVFFCSLAFAVWRSYSAESEFYEFDRAISEIEESIAQNNRISISNQVKDVKFYYRAQFNLAPRHLVKSPELDTLLLISEMVEMAGYSQTLKSIPYKNFHISLLTKDRQ